ncbi:MAG: hypothetical protein IT235_03010 [Bacteroidia bacterium]|nr:hypothetical protein [Bacteroidia bacterium]
MGKDSREVNRKVFSGVLTLTGIFLLLAIFLFLVLWGLMEFHAYFKIRNWKG